MKSSTSSRGSYLSVLQHHALVGAISWCVFLIGAPLRGAEAQMPAGIDSDSAAAIPAPDVLASREEELRRKEAELLKAISSGDSVQARVIPEIEASGEKRRSDPLTIDARKLSPPLEAPVTSVTSAEDASQTMADATGSAAGTTPEVRALQEMGNHPALEPKRTTAPPSARQPKIASRRWNPNVRKPDTFRRVARDRGAIESDTRLFASSRTVSIQEIEAERNRPAPFAYDAIATIAGRDATLRTGPRSAERALGSAPRFSEVSIDYRTGDWYRVQTTFGLRGWTQGRNLLFDAGISPSSAVRIGAIKAESAARRAERR